MSTGPGRTALSRRRVLAGLGLGLPLLAGLAACGSSAAAVPTVPVRLHTDWTVKPGGTTPVVGDDGVPFHLAQEGSAPPPAVLEGALEGQLPEALSSSSLAQEMRAEVRRIGATFALGPGSPQGALTLAAWTGVPFVTAQCHLVLTAQQWILGVVEQGALRVVRQDGYGSPLRQDGATPYTADVTFAGDTATLALPDGGSATVSDPAIGATLGTVPAWQFYKNGAGGADVRLLRTWAG
ncbi:hypothetical protein [Actinomycetospora termitidis]|uniref:Lipoprotein n=1 Tax=Actinomycetospora termitidis TaxID=3053470 RepID=A0ABT7MGW5_9PSEU|nr:hypothetical protein [Actinomycetospora sp. Odt1-22]MDL5159177.1 hypothetical protein [Actinomycetospora sp. Odt1-22]